MLTPVDIENKEFGKAFRGYDIDEVEEFLQTLVNDYEKIYRENATLKEKNAMLQETIGNYRGMEETMQNAIIAAQKTAEDIKRNAYHRAENITREAQTRANEAIASADKTIQELENSYLALQGEVDAYRARMRSLLETNLKLLDDMPRVEIKSIDRVKIDPVTIDSVQHTSPVPEIENAKLKEENMEDTMPVPPMPEHVEDLPEAGSVSMAERETRNRANDQRVPLSEKIPVAQTVRGTHINPVVEKLMKEKNMKSEKTLQELEAEEEDLRQDAASNAEGFRVKKETVDVSSFDTDSEKEIILNVESDKKNKKHPKDDSDTYYDVFKDFSL